MKRKPIPQQVRKQVYEKYNGHCAYCGCELDIKESAWGTDWSLSLDECEIVEYYKKEERK